MKEKEGLQTVGYSNLVNNFDGIVEDVFFYVERNINGFEVKVTKNLVEGGDPRFYHIDRPEKLIEESEMPAFKDIEVDKVTSDQLLSGVYAVMLKYKLSEIEGYYIYELFDKDDRIFFKLALESFKQRLSVLQEGQKKKKRVEEKEEGTEGEISQTTEGTKHDPEVEVLLPVPEIAIREEGVIEAPIVLSQAKEMEREHQLRNVEIPLSDYSDVFDLSFLFDESLTPHLLHGEGSNINIDDILGDTCCVVGGGEVVDAEDAQCISESIDCENLLKEIFHSEKEISGMSDLGVSGLDPLQTVNAYTQVFDTSMNLKGVEVFNHSGDDGTSVLGKRSVSRMSGDVTSADKIVGAPAPKKSVSEKIRGRFADISLEENRIFDVDDDGPRERDYEDESVPVREIYNFIGDSKIRYTYRPLNLKNLPGALRKMGALLFLLSEFVYSEHFSLKGEGNIVICHVSDYDYGEFATLKSSARAGLDNYMNVVKGLNQKGRELFLAEIPKSFVRSILSPMQEAIRRYWCIYDNTNIFSLQKVAMMRAAFLRQDFGSRIEPYGLKDGDYMLLHTGAIVEASKYAYMATEGLYLLKTFFKDK